MPRGGMSKNPFGGCSCKVKEEKAGKLCPLCGKYNPQRLDRLDIVKWIANDPDCIEGGGIPGEQMVWLSQVQSAANDWLYFAISEKNGITAEKWWEAHQFLFRTRSTDRTTWGPAYRREVYFDETERRRKTVISKFTDDQMRCMCFDSQYEMSGLSKIMHLDRFLVMLHKQREMLVKQNWEAVNEYLDLLELTGARRAIALGRQIPFKFIDRFQVLTNPQSGRDVAELLFYEPRLRHAPSSSYKDKPNTVITLRVKLRKQRKRPPKALGAGVFFHEGEASDQITAPNAGHDTGSSHCQLPG